MIDMAGTSRTKALKERYAALLAEYGPPAAMSYDETVEMLKRHNALLRKKTEADIARLDKE